MVVITELVPEKSPEENDAGAAGKNIHFLFLALHIRSSPRMPGVGSGQHTSIPGEKPLTFSYICGEGGEWWRIIPADQREKRKPWRCAPGSAVRIPDRVNAPLNANGSKALQAACWHIHRPDAPKPKISPGD